MLESAAIDRTPVKLQPDGRIQILCQDLNAVTAVNESLIWHSAGVEVIDIRSLEVSLDCSPGWQSNREEN